MNLWGPRLGWGRALAFCAVALLSFAQVRSDVMRAAELAPTPMCGSDAAMAGAMPGMVGMATPSDARERGAPHKGRPACAYCADAAHAPLVADTARLPTPSCVRWTPTFPPAPYLPRGPPRLEPRARGPPAAPLTA